MKILRLSPIGKYLLIAIIAIGMATASLPPLPARAAMPMAGDASLYYANQGTTTSPFKTYTGVTDTWSSESNLGTDTYGIHFIKTLTSPVRNEKLTLLSNTNGQYRMYRWNGSVWSLEWTDSGGGSSASAYTPRFDFAYDYLGNAFVMYSNNTNSTNQMAYRKYTGSTATWGAKTNYTAVGTNSPGNTRYLRVENRPGTDEYAFVWADYQQNLSGNYFDWSSNTFAGEPSAALMDWLAVLSDAGTEIRTRVFDIAFESRSDSQPSKRFAKRSTASLVIFWSTSGSYFLPRSNRRSTRLKPGTST